MYCPTHFAEHRVEVLHALMVAHPLATLVTLNEGQPEANHVPLLLHVQEDGSAVLRGHVAKANPLWQAHADQTEVLAIFQGPQCYVTPAWYASKAEHGKVVPTWNYMVVHAKGDLRIFRDHEWLHQHLVALTDTHEQTMSLPWQVTDAPADYVGKMLSAIVGIEIPVRTLQGKWKISQNRPPADHAGVMQALYQNGMDEMAQAMQKG